MGAQGPGTISPRNRGFSCVVGTGGGAVTRAGSLMDCEAKDTTAKVRMIHVLKVKPMSGELRTMLLADAMSMVSTSKEILLQKD